jgi:hypothetical protein
MYFSTSFTAAVCALVAAQGAAAAGAGKNWSLASFNGQNANSWKSQFGVHQWAYPQPGDKSGSNSNLNLVPNPTNSTEQVMQINYPKGTWNPADSPVIGGVGFYAAPIQVPSTAKNISLTYDVYFPNGFQFNKGGKVMSQNIIERTAKAKDLMKLTLFTLKLPGLYANEIHCSGGASANSCWSSRFMWRANGAGEIYAYISKDQQVSNLCSQKQVICNQQYGYSFGRGSYTWQTGSWNTITQNVQLNHPNQQDGSLEVQHNGKTVIQMNNLMFQDALFSSVGIDFETFFGGSTSDWASPANQYAYFKGFQMSYQ